jgi:hypothetical protein
MANTPNFMILPAQGANLQRHARVHKGKSMGVTRSRSASSLCARAALAGVAWFLVAGTMICALMVGIGQVRELLEKRGALAGAEGAAGVVIWF